MSPLPQDIIIVGGSLSALIHGIMLLEHGHHVHVLERDPGDPKSHMAGIGMAEHALTFLELYDRVQQPLGIWSEVFQAIDRDSRVTPFSKVKRLITTWDALYWRLTKNFDGEGGEYCEAPTEEISGKKPRKMGIYDAGKKLLSLDTTGKDVKVTVLDVITNKQETLNAGLVIGADGPNSLVRRILLPNLTVDPVYPGYVAWRGVVPENRLSIETRKIFEKQISYFFMPPEHIIVYHMPGPKGTIAPGHRLLNVCWYSFQPQSSLPDLLTDNQGHRHHSTVPSGLVRPSLWERQLQQAATVQLPKPFADLIGQISSPFLQLVSDYCVPKAASADGKILLVGDALTLFRPHISFSTNQAAYDALTLQKVVEGKIGIQEWEKRVLGFGYLHWCRGQWFGAWYQGSLWKCIWSAAWYWKAVLMELIRSRDVGAALMK